MGEELGVSYYMDKGYHKLGRKSVRVVQYADDFVIVCKTKEEAVSMYDKLKPYLNKRGLTLAEDKTKVTHIEEGFDFLGFNLRQYKTNRGEFSNESMSYYISRGITRVFQTTTFVEMKVLKLL